MSAVTPERAPPYFDRPAIVSAGGKATYRDLYQASGRAATWFLAGGRDLEEARVAFLVPPGIDHVVTQWAIWRAGGIAVPLALSHPPVELDYVIRDSGASIVIAATDRAETVAPLAVSSGARFGTPEDFGGANPRTLPIIESGRRAMIVYTSGTTGRPKGVVSTHDNIAAQIESMAAAWAWQPTDRTQLVLPLHHVHGIVNVVGTALWSGAICEMPPRFDAEETWNRLASGELTIFMAVPTVYRRLIESWERASPGRQAERSDGASRLRLMISGSAALPVQMLERWREITGHVLLERYGMTETGMILGNPLAGERRPGFVGTPFPGVDVRLTDEAGREAASGAAGEVEVRGPNVFLEYWNRPEETRLAFRDGWFRTGDTAVVEAGAYRLLGRTSVDIIKTGGFKVSALEVEEVLRAHPAVRECAVVGMPDAEWGERICAAVELQADTELTLEVLRQWARPRLAPYKLPRGMRCVAALPRNAMGKVVKPEVARLFR